MRSITRFALAGMLAAGLVALFSADSSAQTEMTGIRAMGMGDAFTASATGAGALFHNPAGMSSLMMYSVEASYAHDMSTGVNSIHASITDGKSNPMLGGGVGYTFSTSSDSAELASFVGHDIYGALAVPAIPGLLIVGLGIHYLDYSRFDVAYAQGVTLDAGVLASLGDFFSVGIATRNILDVEDSGRPLETRFGVNYHNYVFQLGVDTVLDFGGGETDVSYAVGAEVMLGGMVPIRLGYLRDPGQAQQSFSAGVGYRSSLLGGDLLFRQDLEEGDRRMVGLALNLYL